MKTNIDMKEDLKHLSICPLTKKNTKYELIEMLTFS